MTAGNGKIVFVGLDAISTMLAEIAPKEYYTPPERPEPHHQVVGVATDGIKKLATLRYRVAQNLRKLSKEQHMLKDEIHAAIETDGRLSAILERLSKDKSFLVKVKRHEELAVLAVEPEMLASLLDKLLWFEIRRTFPEIADKPAIGFDSKWNIYWSEGEDNRGNSGGLGELIAALRGHSRGASVQLM